MKPTTRNRLFALAALLIAGAGLAYVAFGNIGQNLVFYWTPGEMIAQGSKAYGPTIRLGGVVQPGSLRWDAAHTHLAFRVADSDKAGAPSVTGGLAGDAAPDVPRAHRRGGRRHLRQVADLHAPTG